MNIGKIFKTAVKVAPIVYPIIKKIVINKSALSNSTTTTRKK
ncbi:hypothetical protein [Solibacillus sp. FSL H8-0538]